MRRIVILGVTGSGKTTFGRKLGAAMGVPATDLDDLHWLPGWIQREMPEFYALAAEKASTDTWVIMGNYSKVREAIWPRADTFIWIDLPFLQVFWQLLRRSILRAIDKNPVCNGNIESWKNFFSKESIMLWFFKSYRKRKREYSALFDAAGNMPHVTYIHLRSHAQADAFIEKIKTSKT